MSIPGFSRYPLLFRLHLLLYAVIVPLIFVVTGITQRSVLPSVFILPTLWGCLLVAHWFYASQTHADKSAAERLDNQDLDAFLDGELNYEAIRARADAELALEKSRRRGLFLRLNVAAYMVFMLLAWLIVPAIFGPFLSQSSFFSIILFSIMGLAQLGLHYSSIQLDSRVGDSELRERLIGRAVQRAMDDKKGKFKGKRTLHLSHDGELLDVVDDLPDERHKSISGKS